ncbi:MAG: hypothetical protein HYR64_01675 [Fimbriimonas ginsengisoli]|uniref:Uncharacterized protein n=1 Tax=Fimbriimonas ginsengisoli TaxID=1005039 RepID=A0A931LZ07_FIMGI|nr:hypothetical protein [Fimbriimonas ginsengisoli]
MIVPNFTPDAIEVPGNVTELPYRERVAFIRRVAYGHFFGLVGLAGAAAFMSPQSDWRKPTLWLFALLAGLNVLRTLFRGRREDSVISAAALPLVLLIAAWWARALVDRGLPVWAAGLGEAFAVLYAIFCGRDFSFTGQFVLAWIASSAAVAWLGLAARLSPAVAGQALAWNSVFLLYWSYDLAALLSRRRKGEEAAAVVDLYRDVFNVFGWTVRVVQHWRQHKIWTVPSR